MFYFSFVSFVPGSTGKLLSRKLFLAFTNVPAFDFVSGILCPPLPSLQRQPKSTFRFKTWKTFDLRKFWNPENCSFIKCRHSGWGKNIEVLPGNQWYCSTKITLRLLLLGKIFLEIKDQLFPLQFFKLYLPLGLSRLILFLAANCLVFVLAGGEGAAIWFPLCDIPIVSGSSQGKWDHHPRLSSGEYLLFHLFKGWGSQPWQNDSNQFQKLSQCVSEHDR